MINGSPNHKLTFYLFRGRICTLIVIFQVDDEKANSNVQVALIDDEALFWSLLDDHIVSREDIRKSIFCESRKFIV